MNKQQPNHRLRVNSILSHWGWAQIFALDVALVETQNDIARVEASYAGNNQTKT